MKLDVVIKKVHQRALYGILKFTYLCLIFYDAKNLISQQTTLQHETQAIASRDACYRDTMLFVSGKGTTASLILAMTS